MQMTNISGILIENAEINSVFLKRKVKVDFYLPKNVADPSQLSLLLINDGQDLPKMPFNSILEDFYRDTDLLQPLLCVGIHCSAERKREYGVAGIVDYLGRGDKAHLHASFVLEELLPYIRGTYNVQSFKDKSYAGFSLGALSALDMVWRHPQDFKRVGVFSGSLWWRNKDQDDEAYSDDQHRIMHQQIRNTGCYNNNLRFFFQCGNMDETKDRNKNGIIDSIDDTLDLIKELEVRGYSKPEHIHYLEMTDGRHDVPTWGRAFPEFLKWGWGRES
jgi:enterochelin esterase-like enzyme